MPVLVLAAVRTPLGALGGALRPLTAPQLGALAIREALIRAELAAESVNEVVMGCAFQAGMGSNPARRAALMAGLPPGISAWTLNQLCASGLMAVFQAARSLNAGHGDFVVAGGFESASNAPYLLPSARWGRRMGAAELRDSLLEDGPSWYAQETAHKVPAGSFPSTTPHPRGLISVEVRRRHGVVVVDGDAWMEPKDPSGQAPPADGAAALVLASKSAVMGRRPLGRILGFSLAPSESMEDLASQSGLRIHDIQPFRAADHLLAVGGAPLLVDMVHTLKEEGRRYGSASLSSGDGQTLSLLLELL